MPTIARKKIWVTEQDFKSLVKTVNEIMEKHPGDHVITGLHDEIAVAKTRFKEGTYRSRSVSQALGREIDDVPLNLSVQEVAVLLSGTGLPESVRTLLLDIV